MAADIDFGEFRQLVRDIGTVPDGSARRLRQAVEKNAFDVKQAWNGKLYSDGHASRTAGSITYDVTVTKTAITADVGAKRGQGRQAGVVRLLENGSVNNGAHGYGAAALQENEDDLEKGIKIALDDALKDAGL